MDKDEIIARLTRERDAARARVKALERMLSPKNSGIIGYRYGPRPWPERKNQEPEKGKDDDGNPTPDDASQN
jgi:hypothetical protein